MKTEQSNWAFNGESVLDSSGRNVCTKANGPLIAATPELLAMLRGALSTFRMIAEAKNPSGYTMSFTQARERAELMRNEICTLISKAEGLK